MHEQSASTRTGGCGCGAVRFVTHGAPERCGLCHCLTCQKAHAAAFFPFVVFRSDQVKLVGDTVRWDSSQGYQRLFCPACGSRIASLNRAEIELSIGSFDDPTGFEPQYESWITRRLPWVVALPVAQYHQNRPDR